MIGTGVGKCLDGACPQADVPDPLAAGAGSRRRARDPAGVRLGRRRAHRRRGDLERRRRLPAPQGEERRADAARDGRDRDHPLPRRLVPRRDDARAPSESVSVISEIARAIFPASSATSFMYYAVQALTFGILVLAANTSYQGFPRLAAVLARDRFFPRQFVNLGDRLVYSNGIIVLAGIAALLIWAFHADVIALIHLYVIGVFTAFTLSQAGMVRYWLRREQPGLAVAGGRQRHRRGRDGPRRAPRHPVEVHRRARGRSSSRSRSSSPASTACDRHYRKVARRLRAGVAAVAAAPPATNRRRPLRRVVRRRAARGGLVRARRSRATTSARSTSRADAAIRGSARASGSSRTCSPTSRSSTPRGRPRRRGDRVPVGAPARRVELRDGDHPGAVPRRVARRRARAAAGVLAQAPAAHEPGVVVTDVPVLAPDGSRAAAATRRVPDPRLRRARRVDARRQLRQHARLRRTRGRSSSRSTPTRRSGSGRDWRAGRCRSRSRSRRRRSATSATRSALPPRDHRRPRRGRGRDHARADLQRLAALLHNQRALYIKRLLLFEPRVILASVPYRLD